MFFLISKNVFFFLVPPTSEWHQKLSSKFHCKVLYMSTKFQQTVQELSHYKQTDRQTKKLFSNSRVKNLDLTSWFNRLLFSLSRSSVDPDTNSFQFRNASTSLHFTQQIHFTLKNIPDREISQVQIKSSKSFRLLDLAPTIFSPIFIPHFFFLSKVQWRGEKSRGEGRLTVSIHSLVFCVVLGWRVWISSDFGAEDLLSLDWTENVTTRVVCLQNCASAW